MPFNPHLKDALIRRGGEETSHINSVSFQKNKLLFSGTGEMVMGLDGKKHERVKIVLNGKEADDLSDWLDPETPLLMTGKNVVKNIYGTATNCIDICVDILKGLNVEIFTETDSKSKKTAISRPTPRTFDTTRHYDLINSLSEDMKGLEFERLCKPIVYDILQNYEKFRKIEKGPNFIGTPFDFFGFKDDIPYIIEFKGSLHNFNSPGGIQKRRMKELLKRIKGLRVALLQVKLRKSQYRIFYNDDMNILFHSKEAPIEPIVDWINMRVT